MWDKVMKRQYLLLLADIILVNLAFLAAMFLRFDFRVPGENLLLFRQTFALFTLICVLVFYTFGLYKKLWQYASISELINIFSAVSVSSLLIFLLSLGTGDVFSRSVYIIFWILCLFLVGGTRFALRCLQVLVRQRVDGYFKKTLIVGAGDAGAMVAKELEHNRDKLLIRPIGFVDDDLKKKGQYINSLPVLGNREDIPEIVRRHQVEEIIIAMPSAPRKAVREIVNCCKACKVRLKILPGMYQLIGGRVSLKKIRDVDIEDLLCREPVQVDLPGIAAYLQEEVVLVTGGGGSIGSELCRQVLKFKPKALLILGQGENSVYEIHRELVQKYPGRQVTALIGNVQDRERLQEIFTLYRPGVIFHAAAHKHVPLMEENPAEAIKNNILGTRNVAEAAHRFRARRFVLVSTDKAVNPTSVMGTTKRIAEMVVQAMARSSQTSFCAVRFGNVLGSRGSVVPLFKEQIAKGGPVTVTHPEMVRYFMTIPEAVQLIIQAGSMGGEGEIFLLDMGEPVKIVDLARDLIRLTGFEPGEDIDVEFSGIRPGEKLYEEMLTGQEGTTSTRHEKIFIARSNGLEDLSRELKGLNKNIRVGDKALSSFVPGLKIEMGNRQYGDAQARDGS